MTTSDAANDEIFYQNDTISISMIVSVVDYNKTTLY